MQKIVAVSCRDSNTSRNGFTLIEMVFGIVLFSIVLVTVVSVVLPQALTSAGPVNQVRSAELAHSFMSEIFALSFDENSNHSGGFPRCNDAAAPTCTAQAQYGPDDGEFVLGSNPRVLVRSQADDVDDYHNQSFTNGGITDVTGERASLYEGFTVNVVVTAVPPVGGGNVISKIISVNISSPNGNVQRFSAIRSNF